MFYIKNDKYIIIILLLCGYHIQMTWLPVDYWYILYYYGHEQYILLFRSDIYEM